MKKWLASILKQALTAFGAVLVAGGVADAEAIEQFVDSNVAILSGAIVYGIGQLWDLISKK